MNLGRTPCRCIHSETTLPPPCTTTGRTPSRWSATTSRRLVSWLPSVLPPIFTTIVPSCKFPPPGLRLSIRRLVLRRMPAPPKAALRAWRSAFPKSPLPSAGEGWSLPRTRYGGEGALAPVQPLPPEETFGTTSTPVIPNAAERSEESKILVIQGCIRIWNGLYDCGTTL